MDWKLFQHISDAKHISQDWYGNFLYVGCNRGLLIKIFALFSFENFVTIGAKITQKLHKV